MAVTKEQVEAARKIDLLDYLRTYEPSNVKKSAQGEYCLTEHDSLKISNGRWFWHSQGFGGKGALDFLTKVRDVPFQEAVQTLTGGVPIRTMPLPEPKKRAEEFRKPWQDHDSSEAINYLKGRGIDEELIKECIRKGIIYQSKGSVVFLGKNAKGEAKYAGMREITGSGKKEVYGSDKSVGFSFLSKTGEANSVSVFESPIDALSVETMARQKQQQGQNGFSARLSLGGTTPRALLRFLEEHPNIESVKLCLDNDEAGRLGVQRCTDAIRNHPVLNKQVQGITVFFPPAGKDWNEALLSKGKEKSMENKDEMRYAVYQTEGKGKFLFFDWHKREYGGVQPQMYRKVYEGKLPQDVIHEKVDWTLERLYEKLNLDKPEGYQGHSLSVSDVVTLSSGGETTAYFVDSVGFQKIPWNYLQTVELSTEQNYNQIDGIINNTPPEPEQKQQNSRKKEHTTPQELQKLLNEQQKKKIPHRERVRKLNLGLER